MLKTKQKDVELFLDENPQYKNRKMRPEAISKLVGASVSDVKLIIALDRVFRLLTLPDAKSDELAEQAKMDLGYVPTSKNYFLDDMKNDTFLK